MIIICNNACSPQDFSLSGQKAGWGGGHPNNLRVYEEMDKNIGSGGNELDLIKVV